MLQLQKRKGKTGKYKGISEMQSVRLTCHMHRVDRSERLQQQCLYEEGDQVEGRGGEGWNLWSKSKHLRRLEGRGVFAQNVSWRFAGLPCPERETIISCFLVSTKKTHTVQTETPVLKMMSY